MTESWLEVYKAANALEAHSLKGMLEAENIEVCLRGEGLLAAVGELSADVVEVTIWVASSQFGLARQLLADYEQVAHPPWFCPECSERNEGSFEICWHCGRESP
ncbi:hypothetical protein ABT56_04770 [Photobacterium aquae]|uniref:RanBP2-type domain-containing protein n=1 Tax=Photobacterium aquae TaxID=1195763 RepID=A0A0J1JYQ9_9GAMM|nr:DUF2007 domain-containing protein [Photobacterium aquae]KLV07382.1 hypothetical protein ABT56_04770 [Photobacterium aquae]